MGNPWDKPTDDDLEGLLREDKSRWDSYGKADSKCSHKGSAVSGVAGLLGSSYRGGLTAGASVKVLLAREALERLPLGESTVYWWPIQDMSVPEGNYETIERLIYLHKLHRAGRVIEVACYGGHGRTGLVLAVLAALDQGWPANEAVKRLRDAYCQKAVENQKQEWFVERAITAARQVMSGQIGVVSIPPSPEPEPRLTEPGENVHRVTSATNIPTRSAVAATKIGGIEGLRQRNAYIIELRQMGMSLQDIADEVGLSPNRVSEICHGK